MYFFCLPQCILFLQTVLDARKWNQWDLFWILRSCFVANYLPTSQYQFVIWQHLLRASYLLPKWTPDQCKQAALEMNQDLFRILSRHSPCKFCDKQSESVSKDSSPINDVPCSSIFEAECSQTTNQATKEPISSASFIDLSPELTDRQEWAEHLTQYSRRRELKSIEKSKLRPRPQR